VDGPGEPLLKVLDFGIAKVIDRAGVLTQAEDMLGTPLFMAPEQIMLEPVTEQTDQYALAATLYYTLCGAYPFMGRGIADVVLAMEKPAPHLSGIKPSLPKALGDVVARALAKSPGARFESLSAFAAALLPWATPHGVLVAKRLGVTQKETLGRTQFISERAQELPFAATVSTPAHTATSAAPPSASKTSAAWPLAIALALGCSLGIFALLYTLRAPDAKVKIQTEASATVGAKVPTTGVSSLGSAADPLPNLPPIEKPKLTGSATVTAVSTHGDKPADAGVKSSMGTHGKKPNEQY
jgi:serine/threonine protein kinase